MLFTTTIAQYDVQINSIKAQIEELRRILSEKEHERQNLLSVEQMWQSAIAQLEAAKVATESIGQAQLLVEAEAAVTSVFRNVQYLSAAEEAEPAATPTTPAPAPETPQEESQPTIEVKSETIAEETPTDGNNHQEEATQQVSNGNSNENSNGNSNGNGNSNDKLSYEELAELDRAVLLKLVKDKGIEVTGSKTVKRLSASLEGKVTKSDLN